MTAMTTELVIVTADTINSEFRKATSSMVESANHIIRCGKLLTEKKEELGHGNFIPWVETECEFSPRVAQMMMKQSAKAKLASHLTEEDAIALSRDTWGHTKNHLTNGTGENEWYTPPDIINVVKEVLGEIDVDPASNIQANETVGAKTIFTKDDDGLTKPWMGRVFLNPPYSRDLMPKFVDKLITEYQEKRTTSAILVSHNNTETYWFQSLAAVASAVCFPSTRIKFYRDEKVAAPVNGQVFFYLGNAPDKFESRFADFGGILLPADLLESSRSRDSL